MAQTTYLGDLDCFAAWLERLDDDLSALIESVKKRRGERPEDLEECAP